MLHFYFYLSMKDSSEKLYTNSEVVNKMMRCLKVTRCVSFLKNATLIGFKCVFLEAAALFFYWNWEPEHSSRLLSLRPVWTLLQSSHSLHHLKVYDIIRPKRHRDTVQGDTCLLPVNRGWVLKSALQLCITSTSEVQQIQHEIRLRGTKDGKKVDDSPLNCVYDFTISCKYEPLIEWGGSKHTG